MVDVKAAESEGIATVDVGKAGTYVAPNGTPTTTTPGVLPTGSIVDVKPADPDGSVNTDVG
jgi:hypothetical protein